MIYVIDDGVGTPATQVSYWNIIGQYRYAVQHCSRSLVTDAADKDF